MPAAKMSSKVKPSVAFRSSRGAASISDNYRSSSTCASNAAPADPGPVSASGRSAGGGMGRGR